MQLIKSSRTWKKYFKHIFEVEKEFQLASKWLHKNVAKVGGMYQLIIVPLTKVWMKKKISPQKDGGMQREWSKLLHNSSGLIALSQATNNKLCKSGQTWMLEVPFPVIIATYSWK